LDTHTIDIAAPPALQPHLLTIDDCYRMFEVGILAPDARVELIEGQIFDMAPIGPRHQLIVDHLTEVLSASIDHATTILRVQGPVRANEHTLPLPDLAILPRRWTGYPAQHPALMDAYLLIEVSDSTWLADTTVKAGLYARSLAREYWIVDLTADDIVVHRNPANGAYASIERRRGADLLQIEALPAITMTAASIFA
jgi:Uma2 family endonuclease